MEPDAEEGTQQIRALADPMPSPSGTSERTNSLPVGTKMGNEKSDHDSLVTVRLSEPPSLHVNTAVPPSTLPMRKTSYAEYIPSDAVVGTPEEQDDDSDSEIFEPETSARRQANLRAELGRMAMGSDDDEDESRSSSESDRVDWEKLQRTENMESKDQQTTASLLARLEQENAKIAKIQNNIKVKTSKKWESKESRPRPPSMAQLQKMVSGPTPPALRYSTFQQPPMTELEFYLALVKDPKQTAARLPTLLSNKIRRGIPPPLRGVVWQSMAGARDSALEELFERLTGESSPYEGVISKDLGRSFPGVDMFRDPDGDGQRMLGRVLKCFSLYDTKIGYCQGLAFLVGPLLMHMPDKQAFCVLVRLMENYDLRQCFVPDLSGLHVRIYQFRELLRQHLPILSSHLDDLQVEPAYVSQWFLSFFAVTCPLPMLFRIYDVIFAEGASETIMRVALSLMRKNQARILACSELEDVMHLLLSRGLWDCYNYNADEFVNDFVALSDTVTKERLAALEQGYREAKISSAANHCGATDAVQGSADVATAASRFLGRLWASSSTPKPATLTIASSASGSTPASSTLNPGLGATSRPLSMLRRSTSKQSIASTLNSMEAVSSSNTSSAASVLSSVSTEATSVSRDSTTDDSPREGAPFRTLPKAIPGPPSGHSTSKDSSKHLHSQIEDLLTALSELQRNHALLASQLQKEKEEREEDRCAVRSLLDGLRSRASDEGSLLSTEETQSEYASNGPATSEATDRPVKSTTEQLSVLLDAVEMRFTEPAVRRRSSTSQTKSQLRDELARTKEQLSQERAKSRHFDRKLQEMEQEMVSLREQLRESHTHVRNVHQEKQRLEKQIHVMRIRASDTPPSAEQTEWFPKPPGATGLRELKLGRSMSTPSQAPLPYNKRISSATMQKRASREALAATSGPSSEQDALVLELVQAKTAEAVARQEAEEMKQKLEQLRKAFGLALGDTPPASQNSSAATGTSAAAAAMGMFGRLTGSTAPVPASDSPAKASTAPANNASSGGFWGWRR